MSNSCSRMTKLPSKGEPLDLVRAAMREIEHHINALLHDSERLTSAVHKLVNGQVDGTTNYGVLTHLEALQLETRTYAERCEQHITAASVAFEDEILRGVINLYVQEGMNEQQATQMVTGATERPKAILRVHKQHVEKLRIALTLDFLQTSLLMVKYKRWIALFLEMKERWSVLDPISDEAKHLLRKGSELRKGLMEMRQYLVLKMAQFGFPLAPASAP